MSVEDTPVPVDIETPDPSERYADFRVQWEQVKVKYPAVVYYVEHVEATGEGWMQYGKRWRTRFIRLAVWLPLLLATGGFLVWAYAEAGQP